MVKRGNNYIQVNENLDPIYMWETDGYRRVTNLVSFMFMSEEQEKKFYFPLLPHDYTPETEEMKTVMVKGGCFSNIEKDTTIVFSTSKDSVMLPADVFDKKEHISVEFDLGKGMGLYHVLRTYPDPFSNEREEWIAVAPEKDFEELNTEQNGLSVRKISSSFNWGKEFNQKEYDGITIYVGRDYSGSAQTNKDQK